MKKTTFLGFINTHWFEIAICLIILLALFFRFYDYQDRWALAGDQARDAIVARESLRTLSIPALGPFSSAGNFTTGNTWYIWLIASTALFPLTILTPWVVLSLAYTAVVFLMILIGKNLGGRTMGIILGLYAAVSPAQIAQSFNLTNPSLVAVFTTLLLFFIIKFLKKGQNPDLFFIGLFLAATISTHFQGMYLLFLIPILLLFKRPTLKGALLLGFGFFIPFIPYLLHDVTHNFYNIRGIIDYQLYGQYRVYVPNRWLTYVSVFWPELLGKIIGYSNISGFFLIALSGVVAVYAVLKRTITKPIVVILIWLFIVFILLRFYRGERFDGYFIFLHAFILILAAWVSTVAFKFNKYVGLAIIVFFLSTSIVANYKQIITSTNLTLVEVDYWSTLLMKKYPNKKIAIYTYNNTSSGKALPLILFLNHYGVLDPQGIKIGFGSPEKKERPHFIRNHTLIRENKMGYELWDLSASSSAELQEAGWGKIGPAEVHTSTTKWFEK